jgi:DNA-binding CsgD family transcriptional regulator
MVSGRRALAWGKPDPLGSLRRSDKRRIFEFVAIATRLGPCDYESALSVLSEAADTCGAQPFERATIQSLLGIIPADCAGYFEYSGGGVVFGTANTFFVDEPAGCDDLDWESDTVLEYIGTWPLRDARWRVHSTPLKLSDLLTRSQLRRNPWYCEVMRPCGIEHELKVWLPSAPGTVRGFFMVREPGRRDFGERDRALLALLLPFLARIRERWERRHRPAMLTRREAEVLELVAQGLTNAQIAARLVISGTTVRTHLEHIFGKLGVHTRTAAVAQLRLANPAG